MSSLYAWRGKTRRGDIRACGAHSRISNTDTKLLIYGLVQKGRVLAQDGVGIGQIPLFFRSDRGCHYPCAEGWPWAEDTRDHRVSDERTR